MLHERTPILDARRSIFSQAKSYTSSNPVTIILTKIHPPSRLNKMLSMKAGIYVLMMGINSNADHKNRIAFVLLDGRDNDQALSINGIESTNSKAFEAEVADSLINPGGDQLYLQGKTDKTAKWTLNNDQFGLYAPVIITEDNELFTAGLSSRDGHSHLKLIGQNHFAFEDMTHSNNSDFDYNDVVIKVDTT